MDNTSWVVVGIAAGAVVGTVLMPTVGTIMGALAGGVIAYVVLNH